MASEVKVYHNPRCSKSRMALDYLKNIHVEFDVVEYMKNPLSKEELKETIKKLDITPMDLMRKQETDFKEHIKGKDLSDDQLIQAMIDFPKIMERPVVIKMNKAVIARPAEKIKEII